MKKIVAYCGLVCSSCPAFLATQSDDDAARKKTAADYAQKYGLSFKPEEINCDGCKAETGRLIGYCESCEIRKCNLAKGTDNCALCSERPCERLLKFHEFSPEAKAAFDALAEAIG
jgi:hypothetical protein